MSWRQANPQQYNQQYRQQYQQQYQQQQQQQQQQQHNGQQYHHQQYSSNAASTRSLNAYPNNQQYPQQRQQYNNQYAAHYAKNQQQQQQQYQQRLMNAYQSTAPPVASPFLQAQQQQKRLQQQQQQQQMQMQQQQQQQQKWNPVQQANARNNNNNHIKMNEMSQSQSAPEPGSEPGADNDEQPGATASEIKLIPDTTPPTSDDEDDDNDNNNNQSQQIPPPPQQQQQYNGYQRNGQQQQYSQQQQGYGVYGGGNMGNMVTAQHRMQELIASQQKMIDGLRKNEESLRKQLSERDNHWRKSLQNSLNKKDIRINELFQETLKLQNDAKQEMMKVVELKQQIMRLRSESSKMLFSQRSLPNVPGKGNKVIVPPPPPMSKDNNKQTSADSMNMNKSVSIPEDEEVDDNKKEEKKEDKSDGSGGIETEDKPKEEKKNALEALFGARKKPKTVQIKDEKKGNDDDDKKKEQKASTEKKKDAADNPALKKYNKMKKIGMPMVSIINKMRMDGCSKDLIAEFKGEKKEDDDDGDDDEEKNDGPSIDLNDGKFTKYKTMKKINMPMVSIINKMRMDGLSKEEIDAFTGNGDGSSNKKKKKKKDKRSAMNELAIAMGLKPKENIAPTKVAKLKRIHWKVIELKDINGTFWEDINKKYDDDSFVNLGAKFELDFQIRTRKPRLVVKGKSRMNNSLFRGGDGNKKKKRDKKDRITWIQGKRDQNIQIGLKTMGINNEEIYDAIVDMDDYKMTLPRLETIYDLVPSIDEQRKAEEKIEILGDEVDFVGPSELFHIELSTIPEVKTQVTKWLFSRTFKELYMDRLQQVTNIIKGCYAIKQSKALHIYLRIMLQMGNLMNHGIMDKSMAYGFDLESLKLLEGIKNFSGNKTLAMFLYEFTYNRYPEVRGFEEELSILKVAVRTETAAIETSIKSMADEFLNIDLLCRRLHDEYHPGDTVCFREYMKKFSDSQTSNMMNLKVKIQNAQSIAENVASFYGIKLNEGKPENLFKTVQCFVDIMDKAKRTLIKLEKERQKLAAKRAKEKEKLKKQKEKESKKGGLAKKIKLSVSELINKKKEKQIEEEEKGNLLFHDIKIAANTFAKRQKKMEKRLSVNFQERQLMAKGQLSPTMQNNAIKKRLSSQMGLAPMNKEEIEKLRNEDKLNANDDELDDDEYNQKTFAMNPRKSNNLMVPM